MSVICLGYKFEECDVFNVKPQRIYFHIGLPQKETQERLFSVTNKTKQQQMVSFDKPVTEFFKMSKLSPEELHILPGKTLEIRINCHGKLEARPYYDLIKVICPKGCGSYVRLTASPTIKETMKIPTDINLGTVPIGETICYNFKIPAMKSRTPFLFISSIYNPDLTIAPMKGTVCKEPKTIVVSYKPRGYITLSHPIHLYLPTVSVLPLLIYVIADTKPGKLSEMIFNKDEKAKSKFKMKLPFVRIAQSEENKINPQKKNDWSQHKVNLFLLKKDKKNLQEMELLGPFGRPIQEDVHIKKTKQLDFLKQVVSFRKSSLEPLEHNRTVLKQLVVDDKNEWDMHWKVYEEDLNERGKYYEDTSRPLFRRKRLIIKNPLQEEDFNYTVEAPNLWFVHRQILNKFIEAVRRIVVHNRLLHHLEILKKINSDLKKAKSMERRYM